MSDFEPVLVCFACYYCAYTAADMAGVERLTYPAGLHIIKVPCTGSIEGKQMLRPLQKGADGVLVAGCIEGDCHFRSGNLHALGRVKHLRALLEEIGVEPDRLQMTMMTAGQGQVFAAEAARFYEQIKAMGPSPVKLGAKQAA